jgi:predicted nucleic acid-binding protein
MNERRPVFIDTWGWLAFGHRRDPHHEEVRTYIERATEEQVPLYTTEYVLDETITLVFRREHFEEARAFIGGLLQAVETGELRMERITSQRFEAAWTLRQKFQDKPDISFTDLTSMAVMRELELTRVLTGDAHFEHVGFDVQRMA